MIKRETEKILKYEELTIKIQHIWNAKTKAITLITGATGTVSESFREFPINITGRHEIKKLHKTDTLSTTHTAESADVRCKGFTVGDCITCAIYCNSRIVATVYSVGTWFVYGV